MADYTRFQLRGDTKANWLSVNPILAKNEPAIETDTKRFKIGDGVSTYSQLSYGRNTSEYASLYNVTSLFPLPSGYYSHESAVLTIPVGERIKGLIITYETASGVWYTERFIGTNVSGWTTVSNWEKLPDAGDLAQLRSDLNEIETIVDQVKDGGLDDGSIELPKLSPTLAAYIGSGGQVTNQADDDDLENAIINDVPVIREKTTKTYNPDTYSGMGRVILRKNMVNGVNVLTQEMINQDNTIYEIRYDFDLNGQEITIPENCVLQFEGGSFENGTLTGSDTKIVYNSNIFEKIQIKGNFIAKIVKPKYFGFTEDDDILELIKSFKNSVIHLDDNYFCSDSYDCSNIVYDNFYIKTNGNRAFITSSKRGIRLKDTMLTIRDISNINISDIQIENLNIVGEFAIYLVKQVSNVNISDFIIRSYYNGNTMTDGIHLFGEISNVNISNGYIESGDDAISICTEDFYDNTVSGNISNININNVTTGKNTWSGVRLFQQDRIISNININNCNFFVNGDGCIKSSYLYSDRDPKGYIDTINIENVNIYNISLQLTEEARRAIGLFNCKNVNVKNLHVKIDNPLGSPIYIYSDNINIDGVKVECYNRTGRGSLTFFTLDFNNAFLNAIEANHVEGEVTRCIWVPTDKIKNNLCVTNWTQNATIDTTSGIFSLCNVTRLSYKNIPSYTKLVYHPSANTIATIIDDCYELRQQVVSNMGQLKKALSVLSNNVYKDINIYLKEDMVGTLTNWKFSGWTSAKFFSIGGYYKYEFYIKAGNVFIVGKLDSTSFTPSNILVYNSTKQFGSIQERPSSDVITYGSSYYDLERKRVIWWDGGKWVDSNGDSADIFHSGSFGDKPTSPKIGFAYFCTDKQTTEGAIDGIMIYHKGNDVWVDALGRVVS